MESIGSRLRELRQGMRLTQEDVAQQIHCSNYQISTYELDKRLPDYKMLIALCDLYSVTTDYVLGRTPIPQNGVSREETSTLLLLFERLSESDRHDVMQYVRFRLSRVQKNPNPPLP